MKAELKTPYLQGSVVSRSVKSLLLVSLFGGCKSIKPGCKTCVSFLPLQLTRCVLLGIRLCNGALNM